MRCMYCKGKPSRLINIMCEFENGTSTIRDDIIEFCGDDMEDELSMNDVLCTVCMNMIENVVQLKRSFRSAIVEHSRCKSMVVDQKPVKLGKIWASFMPNNDTDSLDRVSHSSMNSPSSRNSPANLLVPHHDVDYNPDIEEFLSQHSKRNCLISNKNSSSRASTPSADKEVAATFKSTRRPRRRRRKSTSWTRVKRKTPRCPSDSSFVVFDGCSTPRPDSCLSGISNYSYGVDSVVSLATSTSSRSSSRRKRSVTPSDRRTRSQGPDIEIETFRCDWSGCEENAFFTVEQLTEHKVSFHKMLLLHYCDICRSKFTTEEDLSLHCEKHAYNTLYCFHCNRKTCGPKELHEHLALHAETSSPCLYCDKSFITGAEREAHVREQHPIKTRKKIRNKLPKDRIHDKMLYEDVSVDEFECYPKTCIVRYLY